MLHLLKETWLPTAIFVGITGAYATGAGSGDWRIVVYTMPMTALIVVPFVWKSFVIRQGRPRVRRALLAGTGSAFMILWSAFVMGAALEGHGGGEGLAGLLVILVPIITAVAILGGGCLASVAAFLQAHLWPSPPEISGNNDAVWDGAVGGGLVATLLSPFAAFFLLLVYQPDPLSPSWELCMLTGASWLLVVPVGAWLGVLAVRRWRRIHAEP